MFITTSNLPVVPPLPAIMRGYGLGLPRWLSGKESACPRKRSLVWEDALEKEMTTHSSILAWEIPWMEEPGRLQSMGSIKSRTRLSDQTTTAAHTYASRMATAVVLEKMNYGLES